MWSAVLTFPLVDQSNELPESTTRVVPETLHPSVWVFRATGSSE
jgi:hypothetical protein